MRYPYHRGVVAGLLLPVSGLLGCQIRTYLIEPEEYQRVRSALAEGRTAVVRAEDEHGAGVSVELEPDEALEVRGPSQQDEPGGGHLGRFVPGGDGTPPAGMASLVLVHENPGPIFLGVGASVLFTGLALPLQMGNWMSALPLGGPIWQMALVGADYPPTSDEGPPAGLALPIGLLSGFFFALQASGLGLMIAGMALWDADPEVPEGSLEDPPSPTLSFAPVLSLEGQVGGLLQVRF